VGVDERLVSRLQGKFEVLARGDRLPVMRRTIQFMRDQTQGPLGLCAGAMSAGRMMDDTSGLSR
jgi:hypothetical protein